MELTLLDLKPQPVTLPDGIVLNHVRAGTGPTLVFIHGAMGDWRAWGPQWTDFTKEFDCISYARRYSHPNPNPLTATDHSALVDAADLEAMMDALDIEQAVLVGSSYGGFTALAMGLRAPERVSAIVAVEPPMMRYAQLSTDGAKIAEDFLAASAEPARLAFEAGDDEAGVRILTSGIVGKAVDEIPSAVLARRMQNARGAKSLALSNDEFPWLAPEALGVLPMPVLLMSGANTAPVHKVIFAAVCKAIPSARSRIIGQSGHSVSQAQPAIFNHEVLSFLHETVVDKRPAAE